MKKSPDVYIDVRPNIIVAKVQTTTQCRIEMILNIW